MSNNYTRREMATALAARLSLTAEKAKVMTEAFVGILSECFVNGQKVELRNFGVFSVVTRKAKVGRNPRNPEVGVYEIPPKKVVRFKMGKALDNVLNP